MSDLLVAEFASSAGVSKRKEVGHNTIGLSLPFQRPLAKCQQVNDLPNRTRSKSRPMPDQPQVCPAHGIAMTVLGDHGLPACAACHRGWVERDCTRLANNVAIVMAALSAMRR